MKLSGILSLLSLMAAFAAFSTGASAKNSKDLEIKLIVTFLEGCTQECRDQLLARKDDNCGLTFSDPDKDIAWIYCPELVFLQKIENVEVCKNCQITAKEPLG
jgi:hypothetical protein